MGHSVSCSSRTGDWGGTRRGVGLDRRAVYRLVFKLQLCKCRGWGEGAGSGVNQPTLPAPPALPFLCLVPSRGGRRGQLERASQSEDAGRCKCGAAAW